jgi:thioredoxin-like negative regulator of GroEL
MKILNSLTSIEDFIENNRLVLLYFSHDMCEVCYDVLPKIEDMLISYPKIKSARVEISKLLQVSGRFSIFTAPTLLLFIDGKETIRESRFISVEQLKDKIGRYYGMLI